MKEVIENPYVKLLESILAQDPEPVEILIYNQEQLGTIRAGLSRARKQYKEVQKFIGEPDLVGDRGFKYEVVEDREGVYRISLEARTPVSFVILPAQPSVSTDTAEKNNNQHVDTSHGQSGS